MVAPEASAQQIAYCNTSTETLWIYDNATNDSNYANLAWYQAGNPSNHHLMGQERAHAGWYPYCLPTSYPIIVDAGTPWGHWEAAQYLTTPIAGAQVRISLENNPYESRYNPGDYHWQFVKD